MTINASYLYSLKTSLNHWLQLQSQMLPACTHSILVSRLTDSRFQIMAQWPKANALLDHETEQAISQVLIKQRLHLVQCDNQQILLCHPIMINDIFWGAVVLYLPYNDKKNMPVFLKKIQSGLVWLQLLLQSLPASLPVNEAYISNTSGEPENNSLTDITYFQDAQQLQLLMQLMQEKSLRESAITLVNLLATRLKATRVSLGLGKQSLELEAISFSAEFDKKTEPMRAIIAAMNEAVDQQQDIFVTVQATPKSVTEVTLCHQQLLNINHLTLAQTFILRDSDNILGAFLIEHTQTDRFSETQLEFIKRFMSLAILVLKLKLLAESSVLQRAKIQGGSWLGRRIGNNNLVKKLVLSAVALFVILLFVPVQYHVSSEAILQGAYKNILVSPQDGFLKSINARPGDRIKKGDLLAQLTDDDLYVERRKIASQMQQYQQEYDNALANSNRSQAAIASAQVDQAAAQLQLIDQELLRTQLLAPVDGIIVSDDISQTLGGPVKQGQVLFEIAAASGFIVQIFVDEREISTIKIGQHGQLKLTSLPGETLPFSVKSVTPISQVREGRNYFRVEAQLQNDRETLRPGMTGTAKISTDMHLLGWIWFHDIWHWFRLKLWW